MGYVRMSTGIVKMVEIAKKYKDELLHQIAEQIIYPEDEIGRTAIDSVYELIMEQPRLITETNRLTQQLYGTSSEKTPQEITKLAKEALEEIKLSRSVKTVVTDLSISISSLKELMYSRRTFLTIY